MDVPMDSVRDGGIGGEVMGDFRSTPAQQAVGTIGAVLGFGWLIAQTSAGTIPWADIAIVSLYLAGILVVILSGWWLLKIVVHGLTYAIAAGWKAGMRQP